MPKGVTLRSSIHEEGRIEKCRIRRLGQDLLDEITDLQDENDSLQDQLDAISDILTGDGDGQDDGSDHAEDSPSPAREAQRNRA
jgi:hypothetical protein